MDEWWHWSHTGQLVSDPLHAGTIQAALHRGRHLMGIRITKAPDVVRLQGTYNGVWVPTLYRLRLTQPLCNPSSPMSDLGTWQGWSNREPVLYRNNYEGRVEGSEDKQLSVIAPLAMWEVVQAIPYIDTKWEVFDAVTAIGEVG